VGHPPSQPYEVYDRMEFDVPVGTNGDCYDRFMVRVEEVRQSWKIARQCLKEMPRRPDRHRRPQGVPAQARRDEDLDGGADPPLQALHRRLHVPAGEVYVATESPKGEFGVYLVATAPTSPTAARSGRPPSATCRRWTS
jgi:NADH-quinone oxidoreductase subunit D